MILSTEIEISIWSLFLHGQWKIDLFTDLDVAVADTIQTRLREELPDYQDITIVPPEESGTDSHCITWKPRIDLVNDPPRTCEGKIHSEEELRDLLPDDIVQVLDKMDTQSFRVDPSE